MACGAPKRGVKHVSAETAMDELGMEGATGVSGGLSLARGAERRSAPTRDADARLMARVQSGDVGAFEALVDRHKNGLVNYLTRLTRCRDRAEDYAQEAFIRLYRHRDRYRERGQLAGYLYRIATNLLRSDERRAARWRSLEGLYRAGLDATLPSPQQRVLGGEAGERVTEALARLPLRYRAPLVLREIEGWSYAEIASALGCRPGTVKSRISRAKARLRPMLESYWNGEDE
mgnify:CR=1 FL=1